MSCCWRAGVDFLQTLALFAAFKFQWPPVIQAMLTIAVSFSFSISIAAPGCSVKLTYSQIWAVVQATPAVLCAAVFVCYMLAAVPSILGYIVRRATGRPGRSAADVVHAIQRMVDLGVGAAFTVLCACAARRAGAARQ